MKISILQATYTMASSILCSIYSWSFSANSILTTMKTCRENISEGIWASDYSKALKIANLKQVEDSINGT